MIIDQLPLLLGDALLTDEFPIERGTTSYKAKLEQILGVAFSTIEPNFAGAYDSTSTYAVGDYVVYEHDLYVCNTAITTAEDWTAAHWTQTDIGTVLESLKSDIDTLSTSKQDKITASGILKGSGSAVSAATLGTDYGARVFQFTLAAADWSNNEQTISSNWLQTSGFVYLIEPVQASKAEYGSAGIYADDVSTQYQITFHCTTTPTSDLTVNVCRIVSANNKTINISGGGSGGAKEWELLWENQSPLAAFAPQSVSIRQNTFSLFMIEYTQSTGASTTPGQFIVFLGNLTDTWVYGKEAGKDIRRETKMSSSNSGTITFGYSQMYTSYGGGNSNSNDYMIPYRIWGIK